MKAAALPKETFRDWLNEFRQDLKFRYIPFRGYYRLRAYKYMLRMNPEMGLLRFLSDPLKDSLDIGANLGLFTYFLSRHSRHVYAFEPNPYPLRTLRSVVDANVTILPIAISNHSGEAEWAPGHILGQASDALGVAGLETDTAVHAEAAVSPGSDLGDHGGLNSAPVQEQMEDVVFPDDLASS